MEPFALVALVAATFLLAGLVKGVVGMGLPPVAIGIMALAMPPAQAAALVLVPAFVTNIWQMMSGRNFPSAQIKNVKTSVNERKVFTLKRFRHWARSRRGC